jgi:hypothetical protein
MAAARLDGTLGAFARALPGSLANSWVRGLISVRAPLVDFVTDESRDGPWGQASDIPRQWSDSSGPQTTGRAGFYGRQLRPWAPSGLTVDLTRTHRRRSASSWACTTTRRARSVNRSNISPHSLAAPTLTLRRPRVLVEACSPSGQDIGSAERQTATACCAFACAGAAD